MTSSAHVEESESEGKDLSTWRMGPHLGVEPKIGVFTPKMDGLFHGKPY